MTRVALLSVTHNRPNWISWLYAQLRTQAEIVSSATVDCRAFLVDSSESPAPDNELVSVLHLPHLPGIASKRSSALQFAKAWQPDYFAWFDDDDWSNPWRVNHALDWLKDEPNLWAVGNTRAPMINAYTLKSWTHRSAEPVIFNGAVYRWGNPPAFNAALSVGEDTDWNERYLSKLSYIVTREPMHAWLCHDTNITNQVTRHCFDQPFPPQLSRFRLSISKNPARVATNGVER